LLIDRDSGQALEGRGGERQTTNNRMEMTAAIRALEALRSGRRTVQMRSDSQYLINMCQEWIHGWKRRGWKRKGGPIKNLDLVQRLDQLLVEHRVLWRWVPGHAGEPGNEYVDALANHAMDEVQAGASADQERRHRQSPIAVDFGR